MDSDTAVNVGAVTTISGLLVLLVKWMIDSESKKNDKLLKQQELVLEKLTKLERALQADEESE